MLLLAVLNPPDKLEEEPIRDEIANINIAFIKGSKIARTPSP
jgi:hypothetical protein